MSRRIKGGFHGNYMPSSKGILHYKANLRTYGHDDVTRDPRKYIMVLILVTISDLIFSTSFIGAQRGVRRLLQTQQS